jgi:hypothetical protein
MARSRASIQISCRSARCVVAVCSMGLLAACGGDPSPAPTAPSVAVPVTTPAPPASLPSGTYEISFLADSGCTTLPEVARRRTYTATIGTGSSQLIDLSNATFGGGGSYLWHTVYARFAEDAAHLFFQDPPVWEQLPDNQYVVIYGIEAVGSIRELPATLSFTGDFTFCADAEPDSYPECELPETVCRSAGHRLVLTRK